VLPHLVLHSERMEDWPEGFSFAPRLASIVSQSDSRVRALQRNSAGLKQILRSFRDEYGRPYSPAVLILSSSLPAAVRHDLAAVTAFRNAVAIPAILRGRAAHARERGNAFPTWSETFRFHAAQLNRNGRMVLQSPSRLGLVSSTAKTVFTPSASVGVDSDRIYFDHYVFSALGRAWFAHFVKGKGQSPYFRRLFRSLEVAFAACGMADSNEGSIQDYGLQVAQWVSAIEILARPEKSKVSHEGVIRFLDAVPTRLTFAKRRYRARVKGKLTPLSLIGRAYTYLYHARNDFLHGNPVAASTLLTRTKKKQVALPLIAGLVFRVALVAFLSRRYPKAESLRNVTEFFEQYEFDQALGEVFGIELTL
jgi:hypothetical protein